MDIRDKLVKLIISNIKQSTQSKNLAFFIDNNYEPIKERQSKENNNDNNNSIIKSFSIDELNDNMVYEIQNDSLIHEKCLRTHPWLRPR